jgi:hypothetical protein
MLKNSLLDHGFQKDNALEGHHVKGQNLVMASKRSSLDKKYTLEGTHVEGRDRGKEVRLQYPYRRDHHVNNHIQVIRD